jgi:hypothetical protein
MTAMSSFPSPLKSPTAMENASPGRMCAWPAFQTAPTPARRFPQNKAGQAKCRARDESETGSGGSWRTSASSFRRGGNPYIAAKLTTSSALVQVAFHPQVPPPSWLKSAVAAEGEPQAKSTARLLFPTISIRVGVGTGGYSLGSPRQLEFGLRLMF